MKYYIIDESRCGAMTGKVFDCEADAVSAIIFHYGYFDYDEVFIECGTLDDYIDLFGEEW